MNKTAATEWLTYAHNDLNGAILLYKASHSTDTISYILHQSIEKSLKALMASNNQPIKKTHNLVELYELVCDENFQLTQEEVFKLSIATTYYTKQRYPTPHKKLPSIEEIKKIIDVSKKIFDLISMVLDITVCE